eukprot:11181119-Lingulodinium_polyedra.AAC.1
MAPWVTNLLLPGPPVETGEPSSFTRRGPTSAGWPPVLAPADADDEAWGSNVPPRVVQAPSIMNREGMRLMGTSR